MKKLNTALLAVVLVSLAFQTPLLADWSDIPADSFTMAPAPKKGSSEARKDFELLFLHQESNRDEACETVRSQPYGTYEEFYFGSSLLSRKEYERVEDLLTRVIKYSFKIANKFKAKYNRPRPYTADARIKPCARKPGGEKSYPSSHATAGVVSACTLAAIFPSDAAEFKKYGKYLGNIRYIAGLHHPSDVKAGQKLGMDICRRLLRNAEFREEIEEIRS